MEIDEFVKAISFVKCSVDVCNRRVRSKGLCNTHYRARLAGKDVNYEQNI